MSIDGTRMRSRDVSTCLGHSTSWSTPRARDSRDKIGCFEVVIRRRDFCRRWRADARAGADDGGDDDARDVTVRGFTVASRA